MLSVYKIAIKNMNTQIKKGNCVVQFQQVMKHGRILQNTYWKWARQDERGNITMVKFASDATIFENKQEAENWVENVLIPKKRKSGYSIRTAFGVFNKDVHRSN